MRTLQGLKLPGTLVEKCPGGRERRLLLCFRGTRIDQLLREPVGFAPRRIQLGGAMLCLRLLAGQRFRKRSLAAVARLDICARLGELATQCAGARHRRGALVLCKAQRVVMSAKLLGLLRDPMLNGQHDV